MNNNPDHRIERTRNRHSRAVLREETVVIRLARNLSAREEREHVEILLRRMRDVLRRERTQTAVRPFHPLLEGQTDLALALSHGRICRFSLRPGKRTLGRRTRDGWDIAVGPQTDRRTLHRFLWRLLCRSERPSLAALVLRVNRGTLVVPLRDVVLRYATSQWGSCSSRGRISLNPALLFLPADLLEYVIVHELAHRLHRGHTKAYWRTVETGFPAFREARKKLRTFRLSAL
ncbi:MAG: YgjP-like metallopeptidase domain-containing protein [Candidatus Peribacteraceae bacterium]|jgi:predicted metal-dependent hydrolase